MIDPARLRQWIYDELLEAGLPPRADQVAAHFGGSRDDALRALGDLKIGKTVLVHPSAGEIWMAGPFASGPTPYAIENGRRKWFANCAWDMLGVAAIVGEPVRLEASCTDCGDPFAMDLDPARDGLPSDWVVHFLLPARRWYDDIGFT